MFDRVSRKLRLEARQLFAHSKLSLRPLLGTPLIYLILISKIYSLLVSDGARSQVLPSRLLSSLTDGSIQLCTVECAWVFGVEMYLRKPVHLRAAVKSGVASHTLLKLDISQMKNTGNDRQQVLQHVMRKCSQQKNSTSIHRGRRECTHTLTLTCIHTRTHTHTHSSVHCFFFFFLTTDRLGTC